MEFWIFLFVISNVNLVFTDDALAKERNVTQENTYKVHLEAEDVSQSDQIPESSNSIAEAYKRINPNQIQIPAGKLNGADIRQEQAQQVAQQEVPQQENLRENTVQVQVFQPDLSQGYVQPQQILVQHYPIQPIQILGAEASPLHQTYENGPTTLGYSSYIEHISPKNEEEINLALKEGSVNDIKRLVPKSGISFRIYQNDKNQESQKARLHSKAPEVYSQNSKSEYKIKTGRPVTQFKIQTAHQEHYQPTGGLEVQQNYEAQQHSFEKPQPQPLDDISHSQNQHGVTSQGNYYGQQPFIINHSEGNSQKTGLETSSFLVKPHLKINLESHYGKPAAELNSITESRATKHSLADISNLQYQKQWRVDSKSESTQKVVKNTKPPAALQYDRGSAVYTEKTRPVHYNQKGGLDIQNNINKFKMAKSYAEAPENNAKTNHISNSYTVKTNQNGLYEHLADNAYLDKETARKVINRLLGSESGQSQVVSHLSTNVYASTQPVKDLQGDYLPGSSYPDSETAKTSQNDLISLVPKNSFIETKISQNNFDHQKALEGSTSFDIKNAIDNSGSLIHQTNYVSPAEVHRVEDLRELVYITPKTPTSTISLNNSLHGTSTAEGHQIKGFSQSVITSPHLFYQPVLSSEVGGKFFHQPQTIMWTSEHLKQGNALTPNDFHQSLIRLHLPKEEIYKHNAKTQSVEFPTNSVSPISYQQQKKQPYMLHHEVPLVKYQQEIHFQPKTKTVIQNNQANHVKLAQPVAIDWSLFKSTLPNFSINSLAIKPELTSHLQDTGKKIVPILIRKRKNRSNKQEIGVVYGKVSSNRRPTKPPHRHEKNVRVNFRPEALNNIKQFETNKDRQNEFSVSAFYKVDRSLNSPNNS